MKQSYKYLAGIIGVILVATLFYMKVYIPKTTYKSVKVQKGDMQVHVFGIGNMSAKNIYNVTAGVAAKVLTLYADEGDWVKKGALLAKLDPVDLPELLQEAKVAVKKARSEYMALQKELESLRAQKELAKVTFERYKRLKEQAFASQAEYDKAKADLDAINAQIEATKAHLRSSATEIQRAQKGVDAIQEKLKRFLVYAPVSGYITDKAAQKGESLLSTQTLFKMVKRDEVWVDAYIDERISGDVAVGQKAFIVLRSRPKQRFVGKLSKIDPQSDPVTQERKISVAFEELPVPFYLNEQAEVTVLTKKLHDVFLVPAVALRVYKQKKGVWVKEGNKAHFVPLRVLAVVEDKAAVEGIARNATVLIPSEFNKPLSEGMRVH